MTTKQQMTMRRIELPTPLPVGTVNAFLLSNGDQSILVDCGPKHPQTKTVLLGQLKALGLQPGDLDGLVLTHGHVDHTGLTSLFQSAGVPVFAPPQVDTWLNPGGPWDSYREEFYFVLYTSMGMPTHMAKKTLADIGSLHLLLEPAQVDVELVYGESLPCMPQFEVLHVPGHAQHACALYDNHSKQLIVGDQVLARISSNALIEPKMDAPEGRLAERTKSLLQYRRNLRALKDLDVERVHPGHGEVFTDFSSLIDKRLHSQEKRKSKFKELVLQCEDKTTFGIATVFFPKHWDQLQLIMSETLGYLDWLAEDGEIREVVDDNGIRSWRPL